LSIRARIHNNNNNKYNVACVYYNNHTHVTHTRHILNTHAQEAHTQDDNSNSNNNNIVRLGTAVCVSVYVDNIQIGKIIV